MNNYTLVKLVVAIARQGAADHHDGCKANCPTEISAQRR
jgi:hypothetical protein